MGWHDIDFVPSLENIDGQVFYHGTLQTKKEGKDLMNYTWILLENLNDGLQMIWLALLAITTFAGISFFMESAWDLEKAEGVRLARQKRQYFRRIVAILLALGTVLVALPGKGQMTLLRGACADRTETQEKRERSAI